MELNNQETFAKVLSVYQNVFNKITTYDVKANGLENRYSSWDMMNIIEWIANDFEKGEDNSFNALIDYVDTKDFPDELKQELLSVIIEDN